MRISFIGSGNVATHLALAMFNRGHKIDQVWSRDIDHANLLAQRVEARPINDFAQLNSTANVYIIAVKDDALYDIALDLQLGDALVVHTSGATPMEVLKHTSSRYGVLWSPQSFVRDMALDYSELPFCIQGCDEKTEFAIDELIRMISSKVYHTTFQQRQYLHLSAVFVNNFAIGLFAVAQEICKKHDIPFEVLHPLIINTANKVKWGDVRYQLTGPASRGDQKTIDSHRALLADEDWQLAIYDYFTELIQKRLKIGN